MTEEKIYIGVDDAGRSPMFGPMFISAVAVTEEEIKILSKIGVRDSKKVSRQKRRKLYKEIIDIIDKKFVIVEVQPHEIDLAVGTHSLNVLSNSASAEAVNKICEKFKYNGNKTILIDACCFYDKEQAVVYIDSLLKGYARNYSELVYENKADKYYIPVSTASIIATYTRQVWEEKFMKEYGFSPSIFDLSNSKEFMKYYRENGLPKFTRKSWKPIKRFLNNGNG